MLIEILDTQVAAELLKHFRAEDEEFGICMGILTGKASFNFAGMGTVEIDLTEPERAEYLSAILKARSRWFGFLPIAYYMSDHLESLLSGHQPERYRVI